MRQLLSCISSLWLVVGQVVACAPSAPNHADESPAAGRAPISVVHAATDNAQPSSSSSGDDGHQVLVLRREGDQWVVASNQHVASPLRSPRFPADGHRRGELLFEIEDADGSVLFHDSVRDPTMVHAVLSSPTGEDTHHSVPVDSNVGVLLRFPTLATSRSLALYVRRGDTLSLVGRLQLAVPTPRLNPDSLSLGNRATPADTTVAPADGKVAEPAAGGQ